MLSRLIKKDRPSEDRALVGLIVWLALCFCAAAFGSFFRPGPWYAHLQKPSWTPPPAVFGPVWTALYIMMAIAAWLVWKQSGFKARTLPLGLFILQLALNAIWSPLCFGLHSLAISSVDIVLLWLVLLITTVLFFRISKVAGYLLVPYLAWISYASCLNITLWRLNGS